MEKTVFIKLLEYGESIGLEGTDSARIAIWAEENNVIPPEGSEDHNRKRRLLGNLFVEAFIRSTDNNWVLSAGYYFRLLEYRELTEARQASKQANRNSWIAIGISTMAILSTIYIGYAQNSNSIKIDSEQLTEITKRLESIGGIRGHNTDPTGDNRSNTAKPASPTKGTTSPGSLKSPPARAASLTEIPQG